ncbi:MAG TPA: hypothetical protein DIU15_03345 [Deltaproteobacteria bacterium]|nr:hypothetical protein [Deltaproteobacteria bacterium]HCP45047.1 hypothetical protein [Deltaproteobacteria bacterium]
MARQTSGRRLAVTPWRVSIVLLASIGLTVLFLKEPAPPVEPIQRTAGQQKDTSSSPSPDDRQHVTDSAPATGRGLQTTNPPDDGEPGSDGEAWNSSNDSSRDETADLLAKGPDEEGWHTRWAAQGRDQRSFAPDDPEYDASVEAQQLFHPMEEALRAARPLTPSSYKEVLGNHKDTSAEVFNRAGDLIRQEQPEAAKELLDEWNRLYLLYKDEAYPAQARPRPEMPHETPIPSDEGVAP